MTRTRIIAVAAGAVILAMNTLAADVTPGEIFEKAKAAYGSMQTYKAEGTIISDIDIGGMTMQTETSFSMLLKKPNLYLISWNQKNMLMPAISQSGAVWSDSTQPYLYMGIMGAYSKMSSDELALSAATGISGGATFTIPSFFLSAFKGQPNPFSRLKDPRIEKIEKVGEDDCYVIGGPSAISKKETFWISKAKYLIRKYDRSLEAPEGGRQMPELTDNQIEDAIKLTGQQVTDESRKSTREMMKMVATVSMKGSSTELHANMSSPELARQDFHFALPAGTVLKESLVGDMLGAVQGLTNKAANRLKP